MSVIDSSRATVRPKCSIVIPVLNEETNIEPFYEALANATNPLDADWEFIFVDDGSTDNTFTLAESINRRDPRVKVIRLSRNFGSHAAITAGYLHATGDVGIQISADFQDPPELFGPLLQEWRHGYDIVWAVREQRDDPFLKSMMAEVFWFAMRKFALPTYPKKSTDGFGLLDRKVIDQYLRLPERIRMGPLLITWLGFRRTEVPYHRQSRRSGHSKWGIGSRIKAAVDSFLSFSYLPIRMATVLGLMISVLSFFLGLLIIIQRTFFGIGAAGWPSVMTIVLFLGGMQLMVLGILGEYIWRIAEEVRNRPLFIIMDKVGIDSKEDDR